MPVKNGKCVKTGASVNILEYGCVAHGDIFQVGDNLVFSTRQQIPTDCEFPKLGRPLDAPFELTIGLHGFLQSDIGRSTIVIPRSQLLKGELVGAD